MSFRYIHVLEEYQVIFQISQFNLIILGGKIIKKNDILPLQIIIKLNLDIWKITWYYSKNVYMLNWQNPTGVTPIAFD